MIVEYACESEEFGVVSALPSYRRVWEHSSIKMSVSKTDFEVGSDQVARVPVKPDGIKSSDALFRHGALLALLEEKVLAALMLNPDIERSVVKLGRDGAMSIGHSKGLESFESSVPHSTMRIENEADLQELGLAFIGKSRVMTELLSLELMALSVRCRRIKKRH